MRHHENVGSIPLGARSATRPNGVKLIQVAPSLRASSVVRSKAREP